MEQTIKAIRLGFNLVEVALAMGVVAIGMAGVMGLYPLALRAARNSVAKNYSMLSAGQLQSLLQTWAESNWDAFIYPGTGPNSVPDSKPTPLLLQQDSASNWSNNPVGDIYISGGRLNPSNGIYGIVLRNAGTGMIDFSAHLAIWRAPITNSFGADSPRFFTDNNNANSAIVNIEISWPVEKPYAAREKRIFPIILSRRI